jgi:hypothetical protein
MSHDAEQATNSPMAYNSRLTTPPRGRRSYLDLRLHSYPILQLSGSEESIIPADGKIGID